MARQPAVARQPDRVVTVRAGGVRPTGSWLYVWLDLARGRVAYVGATGFDPELRAHLHLTSDDPEIGRVRAAVPDAASSDFDVLAFRVPPELERPRAKAALLAGLAAAGLWSEAAEADAMPEFSDGIVAAIRRALPAPA